MQAERTILRVALALVCAGFATLACGPAASQEWPARPVSVLVPFSAGGSVDIIARTIGERLRAELGQPFVVDNRAGAGGTIATGALARSAPDGYTLLFFHMGLAFNAALYDKLPYDTQKDVLPIACIGATPNVLVVNNALPVKSVADFLALARAKPGSINYGSGGVGSAGHLSMELLQSLTHVQLVHVPYKGSGPAISDLVSGQIQTMLLTIPAVMSFLNAGTLRPLATSGRRRSPALPTLPTLAESGVDGFDYAPWYGVFAPGGTPPALAERIHAAVNRAIEDPEIAKKLASQGLEPQPMSREDFAAMLRSDLTKWAEIIRKLGIKPH